MTRPVSIVIPSLGQTELLEANLPPLLAELERRALADEVVVVDDTGAAVLEPFLRQRFPAVVVETRTHNGGFATALRAGVERARHELVFSMNPDVRVRPPFLDALVACLDELSVAAVVPRVLLNGDEERLESLVELEWRAGFLHLHQWGLESTDVRLPIAPVPVAFAVGGTVLLRKRDFLATGGFDELFAPFYWEDVDWCWTRWREGRRIVYQPASVVEHHHRGTIGKIASREFVRAAIEKNRLLFHWKHVDEAHLEAHVAALYRQALDAHLCERRSELVWLALALEQARAALAARRPRKRGQRSFAECLEAARPFGRAGAAEPRVS
jgi:GT2 family glycosyltransferase